MEPLWGVMGENVAAGTAWSKMDIATQTENHTNRRYFATRKPEHAPAFSSIRCKKIASSPPQKLFFFRCAAPIRGPRGLRPQIRIPVSNQPSPVGLDGSSPEARSGRLDGVAVASTAVWCRMRADGSRAEVGRSERKAVRDPSGKVRVLLCEARLRMARAQRASRRASIDPRAVCGS